MNTARYPRKSWLDRWHRWPTTDGLNWAIDGVAWFWHRSPSRGVGWSWYRCPRKGGIMICAGRLFVIVGNVSL